MPRLTGCFDWKNQHIVNKSTQQIRNNGTTAHWYLMVHFIAEDYIPSTCITIYNWDHAHKHSITEVITHFHLINNQHTSVNNLFGLMVTTTGILLKIKWCLWWNQHTVKVKTLLLFSSCPMTLLDPPGSEHCATAWWNTGKMIYEKLPWIWICYPYKYNIFVNNLGFLISGKLQNIFLSDSLTCISHLFTLYEMLQLQCKFVQPKNKYFEVFLMFLL